MRFWDSSAVVPLLFGERTSDEMLKLLEEDRDQRVWWATEVECESALARTERAGASSEISRASELLEDLGAKWSEIGPTGLLRETARRLVRVHPLRASDALQLAAALVLADGLPSSVEVVSLDDRLRDAALREGFVVLPKRRR